MKTKSNWLKPLLILRIVEPDFSSGIELIRVNNRS